MYEKPELLAEVVCFLKKIARFAFDIHNMPLHAGIGKHTDLYSIVAIEHY
jgi:hypothetical protein